MAAECGLAPGRLALLALPLLLQAAMYAVMLLCFWLALLRPRPPLLVLAFLMSASLVVALAFLRTFALTQVGGWLVAWRLRPAAAREKRLHHFGAPHAAARQGMARHGEL